MATPAKRAQIASTRARARGAQSPAPAAVGSQPSGLDSLKRQDEILNPAPIVTTVGGAVVSLHELPAKQARQFVGLVSQVMSAATGSGPFLPRLRGVLAQNARFSDAFVAYVARAQFPADAKAEQLGNLEAVAAEIDEKATFLELGVLLDAMVNLNHVFEAFAGPN